MLSRNRTCSGLQVLQSGPLLLMFGHDASLAEGKGKDLEKKEELLQNKRSDKIQSENQRKEKKMFKEVLLTYCLNIYFINYLQ